MWPLKATALKQAINLVLRWVPNWIDFDFFQHCLGIIVFESKKTKKNDCDIVIWWQFGFFFYNSILSDKSFHLRIHLVFVQYLHRIADVRFSFVSKYKSQLSKIVEISSSEESVYGTNNNTHVPWVLFTASSVTTSNRLQRADFFASKSLTAMLKSFVTTSTYF